MVRMLTALGVLFAVALVVISTMRPIVETADEARTNTTSETGLNCTTGVGETTCGLTLADNHAFVDDSYLTVTETSPGSGTRTATVNSSDTTQITVTGLSASTSYTFDVAYRVVDPNVGSGVNGFLSATGLLWGLVILVGSGLMITLAFRNR